MSHLNMERVDGGHHDGLKGRRQLQLLGVIVDFLFSFYRDYAWSPLHGIKLIGASLVVSHIQSHYREYHKFILFKPLNH
jgi:hypothetical protein